MDILKIDHLAMNILETVLLATYFLEIDPSAMAIL